MPRWALALPLLIVVAAAATAVGVITAGKSSKAASVSGGFARVGETAPQFTSWDLNGNKVSLADLKGHPVLITFWATWCTACQQELPAVEQIRDRYQAAGLKVLAVNYRETNVDRMRQFLAGLNVNLAAVTDTDGSIATAYGVDIGLPISVLLDRNGRVLQIMIGAQSSSALDAAVSQVAGPAPSP